MYSITYGDDLLYDPLDRDAYPVYDVSLSAEINGSGSCEFSITKTHPLYDVIDLYDTNRLVTVTEDSHILFKGYVSSVDEDEYGVRTYSCTGILSFLKKSVVRPYSTDAEDEKHVKAPSTIDGFFNWLISEHNNHTDRRKRFIVGRNEGDIVWNENVIHVSRDSTSTTADVLQSELLDGLGGYVFVRYGDDGVTYLDYLSECRDTNAQVIDFGVNLVSYSRTDDATDVATVCYARGGTPEKDEGSDKEKPPVDLTKYPDGPFARGSYRFEKRGDRIICLDLVDKYGYSEMTFEDSNILDPYALLASASIALLKQLEPKITIDIRAIDLSLFMDGYKPMRCGELVRVRSDPNGFDSYMLVSGMDLDLENPENTEYTLGTTFDAFTGESNKIIRQLNAAINKSVDKVASLDQTTKDQAIQIGKVEDVANDASNKADTANTTANQAQSTANTANATATEAKNTADNAKTTATDAKTTADSANKAADAAQSSANKAQGDVDKLKIDIPETYATKSSLTQTTESITANVESVKATANSAVTAASNAQQTADAVTLNLSKNYQTKAQNDALYATQTSLKATSDSLSANITANAKTAQSAVDKATSLEANLNGFKTTVAETYTTKNDFDNLTIGGRNLLLNSNFSKGTDNWVLELQNNGLGTVKAEALSGVDFATTMLTIDVTNNTSDLCRIYQLRSPNPMRTDTVDTVSFWANASETVPVKFGRNDDNRFITVQKGWHYYTATVPKWTTSMAFSIGVENGFIGTLNITNIMWEHASKASQWSPAPEDLQPAGDYSTKSYVDQTAESVALGVVQNYKGSDGSGLATKSDITVATDSITSTVANTYATKSGVTQEISSKITQNNNSLDVKFATKTENQKAQNTASDAQSRIGDLEPCIRMTSDGVRVGKQVNGTYQGSSALVGTDGTFDVLNSSSERLLEVGVNGVKFPKSSDGRQLSLGYLSDSDPDTASTLYIGDIVSETQEGGPKNRLGFTDNEVSLNGGNIGILAYDHQLSMYGRKGANLLVGYGGNVMVGGQDDASDTNLILHASTVNLKGTIKCNDRGCFKESVALGLDTVDILYSPFLVTIIFHTRMTNPASWSHNDAKNAIREGYRPIVYVCSSLSTDNGSTSTSVIGSVYEDGTIRIENRGGSFSSDAHYGSITYPVQI